MRGEKEGTGGARERPQNDRRDAKGSTLDGGTAKATAADLQREKTPRNGRARARPLGVFPAPKCRVSLYKKSLAQEEGYGACFSREGSAEVKSENRS